MFAWLHDFKKYSEILNCYRPADSSLRKFAEFKQNNLVYGIYDLNHSQSGLRAIAATTVLETSVKNEGSNFNSKNKIINLRSSLLWNNDST